MKKITLIAAAFIAVSFASCSKAKTCTCTTTSGGSVDITTTSYDKTSMGNAVCPKTDTYTRVQTTTAGGSSSTNTTNMTSTCVLS